MTRPFVIAVASEKGGVGKTTIATNLAVYLKALREDLPVTIASFDNHFSVDQMFALGPRPENDIASLLAGANYADLVNMGQYGVQYLASSRRLTPPPHDPGWLGKMLVSLDAPGILILDTRPILDWFTAAALLAADLVLTPVKDRAALVNAEALRQVLATAGRVDRLWLLQSLVDTRARLNADVKVHEFLAYAARERDYQLLDICISKSPKVEGLASGFSSNIRPVLTHARNTAVHGQFRQLAEFSLERFDNAPEYGPAVIARNLEDTRAGECSLAYRRRVFECPVCCKQSTADGGHYFFDMRSRRHGYVHSTCYSELIAELNFTEGLTSGGVVALVLDGPGLVEPICRLTAYSCDDEGGLVDCEGAVYEISRSVQDALASMIGKALDDAYRELILLNCAVGPGVANQNQPAREAFAKKRRKITRELRQAALF